MFRIIFEKVDVAAYGHILKKEVLESANTLKKLSNIDPTDRKNQKHSKQVDLSLAARHFVQKVTEQIFCQLYILSFKSNCIKSISCILVKLQEKLF